MLTLQDQCGQQSNFFDRYVGPIVMLSSFVLFLALPTILSYFKGHNSVKVPIQTLVVEGLEIYDFIERNINHLVFTRQFC